MFLRAQLASQVSSITDFSVSIILVNLFGIYYVFSNFIGSVCGGATNCVVNYRWTFKAMDVKKRYVALRYLVVWGGSIFFNTSGVFLMTEMIRKIRWVVEFSNLFFENIFILPKIIVSLFVGFVWNYNMHKYFVFKNLNLKRFFHSDNLDE